MGVYPDGGPHIGVGVSHSDSNPAVLQVRAHGDQPDYRGPTGPGEDLIGFRVEMAMAVEPVGHRVLTPACRRPARPGWSGRPW